MTGEKSSSISRNNSRIGGQGRMTFAVILLLLSVSLQTPPSFTCEAFAFPTHSSKISGFEHKRNRRSFASLSFHNNNNNNNNDVQNDRFGINIKPSRSLARPKTSTTTLHLNFFGMNGKNNDEDEENNTQQKSKNNTNKSRQTLSNNAKEEQDDQSAMSNYLKPSLSFLKIAFPSFLAGTIATLSFIFLPIMYDYYDAYNSMNGGEVYSTTTPKNNGKNNNKNDNSKNNNNNNNNGGGGAFGSGNNINQPVILFETILSDLNEAYVDDVDIQKLFETGVKAMTASLDPYTEFESRSEAQELEESVTGRYGGVGLVIRGGVNLADASDEIGLVGGDGGSAAGATGDSSSDGKGSSSSLQQQNGKPTVDSPPMAVKDGGSNKNLAGMDDEDEDEAERRRIRKKSMEDGVRVVSAFEGYAYDAGFRVGDKLLAVDDFPITPTTSVDDVRDHLRGEPGTDVSITFLREGVKGSNGQNEPQTITMKRTVVQIPDVKYFGFVGDPKDGIGYIDLSGFANNAGREVRFAIRALQHGAEVASLPEDQRAGASMQFIDDPTQLKGLILDLRSNPGGLLTSAVDVATLFVPNGSDIVSARGRGFPESLYRSKVDPILDPTTRLAVLVNEQTASAAEIVTGAIQDLDVGVVVGKGKTFGKGLVQNVQDLPYKTALKYTVAKYFTPSGRCIQSTVYEEGGRGDDVLTADSGNGRSKYKATKVADKDRNVFYTAHGREVRDGGGIEVDYKVEPQRASPLEIILLNSGTYSDFAAEWSKKHELTNNFKVDDATYKEFIQFVDRKAAAGEMKLEVLFDAQLKELSKKLKATGLDSSKRELDKLRADIIKDVKKDFIVYKKEIIEDLEQNILARYLPDSMLIQRGLEHDTQVLNTAKFLQDGKEFDKILARDQAPTNENNMQKMAMGGSDKPTDESAMTRLQTKW